MQIFRELELPDMRPGSVAIGTFDGIHLGHIALLRQTVEAAKEQQGLSVVLTFDRHPLTLLAPHAIPPLLTSMDEKEKQIAACQVDRLVIATFDHAFADLSTEAFVDQLLSKLHAQKVFVGENFSFGRAGRGTSTTLQELGHKLGVAVEILPSVRQNGILVSSTVIRQMIHGGHMAEAARMLGRLFRISGLVVHGEQVGRQIGFPTANLEVDPQLALPAQGVYAVWAEVEGDRFKAMASIGVRPTFNGDRLTFEVHLLDYVGDLYGTNLTVDFVERLRDEKRFATVAELVVQMNEDAQKVRQLLVAT